MLDYILYRQNLESLGRNQTESEVNHICENLDAKESPAHPPTSNERDAIGEINLAKILH